MRSGAAVLLFIFCLVAANRRAVRSWDGRVSILMGERRSPASVADASDYVSVKASALSDSVHAQLMHSATLEVTTTAIGIKFGHPVITTEDDAYEFACAVPGRTGLYDRVRVTLYGTGISDNGDEPHLDVDTVCRSSVGTDLLDTIWIPMATIVQESPTDGVQVLPGTESTTITRTHIPGVWPTGWTLISVHFYRADESDPDLTLSAAELRTSTSDMLSFDWKAR